MKWQHLHKACWDGDAPEVARLLAAGADPMRVAPTSWRQSPLGRTLEFRITQPRHTGHVEVVRLLLKAGADPTARSTVLDMTPFELACFCGLSEAADLLRAFQPAAQPHPSGMTELWLQAASRLPESALGVAANVDGIWKKATPLMMALGHAGRFNAADQLLDAGADPNAGTSILHASCDWHFEYLIPALHYLAAHGWNVNAYDAAGQTALHKAAFLGYASAVRALLELNADATARDCQGMTPLDVAQTWKRSGVMKVMGAELGVVGILTPL